MRNSSEQVLSDTLPKRRPKSVRARLGRWTRPIHRRLTYGFGVFFVWFLRKIPLWAVRPLSLCLGQIAFLFARPIISERALKNLEYAFGDSLTPGERKRRLRRAYLNQAEFIVLSLALGRNPSLVNSRWTNWDEFRREFKNTLDKGKGLIVLTAHVGAWELISHAVGTEFSMLSVAKRTGNDGVNQLLKKVREGSGTAIIFHDESPRKLLAQLRAGNVVGIVGDSTFRGVSGQDATFFGYPTQVPSIPFTLSRKTGASIVFMCLVSAQRQFRIAFGEPVAVAKSANDDGPDIERATQMWCDFLERVIRENPDNWLPLGGHWKKHQKAARGEE